ncbi:hypothetical protein [Microbacterium sp. LWH12-1.2]|uniref:hypothetical protein n=1 Tax=Microbacterium sp. LWH12-1.2 TaxID=3135259 RepID=UPI003426F0DA
MAAAAVLLIVTGHGDDHLPPVCAELDRRGEHYSVIDPTAVEDRGHRTFGFEGESVTAFLSTGDQTVDLSAVSAVWLRSRHRDRRVAESAATQISRALGILARRGVRLVPGDVDSITRAGDKVLQLDAALARGLSVPRTVISDDPEAVLGLAETGIPLVSKELTPDPALASGRSQFTRYTREIDSNDLIHIDDLARAPMIVQERLDKVVELRLTVIGERVFAAAMETSSVNHSALDFRRYDLSNTTVIPWDLDAAIADRCVELVRIFGLMYATIDLVVTPSGDTYFLDLNPNGQYGWIESMTGMRMTEALVDLLTAEGGS